MSGEPPKATPFRNGKRLVLGLVLLALLFWRAGASVVRDVSEIGRKAPQVWPALTFSEEERIQRTLARLEVEYGFEPGELVTLHRIFLDEVGDDDQMWAVANPKHPKKGAIARLSFLTFPLHLHNIRALPPDGPENPGEIDENTWILDLELAPNGTVETWFDLVAHSKSYALWRGRRTR